MVKETDRDGVSFYFVYDGDDSTARCVRTWGDGGIFDHVIDYDPLHNRTFVSDSLGHSKTYQMNPANAVIAVHDAHGATTRYAYTAALWKTDEINPLGAGTHWEHDARGNVIKTVLPNGATSTVTYNRSDQPIEAQDIAGVQWWWLYDEIGRLKARRTSAGELLQIEYEQKLPRSVAINHDRYELRHDDQGNLTHVKRPDGATYVRGFDTLGRLEAWRDVAGNATLLQRDLLGRVLRMTSPDGTVRWAEYSAEGDVLQMFNGYATVKLAYDGFHWLASRTIAGDAIQWLHDKEGRLVEVTNENGEVYKFLRDARGDVKQEVGFDGRSHVFVRDAARRVTMLFKPSKSHQKIAYDVMGNVTEIKYPDGSKESFTHSQTGRLLSATNAAGTAWFERDARGRVLREGFGDDWVGSSYDENHRRVGVATSRGLEEQIERDVLGAVRAVSVPAAGWQATFERNVFGQEVARTLPGGVHATWDRDPEGRPLAQHIAQSGQRTRSTTYRWEGQERIAEITDSIDGTALFYHDERSRLVGADYAGRRERQHRFLDPAGNIYKYADGSDRRYGKGGVLLEAEGTKYAYDNDGNVILKELPSGERWQYVWNGAGRLTEVQRPDGSRVTFKYDALARRVEKALFDKGAKVPRSNVRWVWDGNVPLHELANDAKVTTWLFEPTGFAPLAKMGPDGTDAFVVDQVGAPRALFDQAGNIAWTMQLDAFGVAHAEGVDPMCPWRWPGQYHDEETGLDYNRFRYYDAERGDYVSQDPTRIYWTPRIYGYPADPLLACDPLGLFPWAWNPDTGMGHHLVPRGKANSIGLTDLGTKRDTPTFFPEPYEPGMHEAIHAAQAPYIGNIKDPWTGTEQGLLDAAGAGLEDVAHLRGDLKIPRTGEILAEDVTPAEAYERLLVWHGEQEKKQGGGGCSK
jgi:RHS repeat-associated protein